MKQSYASLLVPALLLASTSALHAQEALISISGTVREKTTQEPLPGVSISVKGGAAGTLSDGNGQFALKAKLRFPFTLVFNILGYEARELEIASGSQPIASNEQEETRRFNRRVEFTITKK